MTRLIRDTQPVEKPGRLQLAIVEWQRQLVAKKEGRPEPSIHTGERVSPDLAA